jgi:hypothetical protein
MNSVAVRALVTVVLAPAELVKFDKDQDLPRDEHRYSNE